jgi:phenylalanyl-tRNA synthetase beta subunit
MRSDENLIRRSLVGTLLATARRNRDRGCDGVRLFEMAPVYVAAETLGRSEGRALVAGLVAGRYADAKGVVDAVLAALGVEVSGRGACRFAPTGRQAFDL